jgi:secondary thiamine-phosphate synthase enzyme
VRSTEIEVETRGHLVTDVTDEVLAFAHKDREGSGLLHLFLPHATAGLALMETESGSESDLEDLIERLLPRDDRYRHRHGSVGHGGDHLLPTLIAPSLVLAVESGEVVLGTWQRVILVDPNRDNNRRTLQLRLIAG